MLGAAEAAGCLLHPLLGSFVSCPCPSCRQSRSRYPFRALPFPLRGSAARGRAPFIFF
jgi:hypothetical protein